MPFGQTFEFHDLFIVGLLVLLEGVLSIDNALVLGLLAKRLPRRLQSRALTYGLVGAFVFRFIAIITATWLMHWWIVKLLGGSYLVYVAVKHFFFEHKDPEKEHIRVGPDGHPILEDLDGRPLSAAEGEQEIAARAPLPVAQDNSAARATAGVRQYAGFWPTVFVIELTDIAFAVDSILAAIALVAGGQTYEGAHPKTWVVIIGGFLGVVLMRFAAVIFIRLLERFPRFELAAYLLVLLIGLKLVADWAFNTPGKHPALNFHSPSQWAFWVFWSLMVLFFCVGFLPQHPKKAPEEACQGPTPPTGH